MGGLGNQMFQYALGRNLSLKLNTSLKLDLTLLKNNNVENAILRDYDLKIFNIQENFATEKEIEYYNGKITNNYFLKGINKIKKKIQGHNLILQKFYHFDPEILKLSDNKCLVGSWQSYKYFVENSDIIKEDFKFKNELKGKSLEIAQEIYGSNSICLNVRRGDYVTHPIYSKTLGFVGLEYYQKSIDYIKTKIKDPKIYIFSDEIEWCKENLKLEIPFYIVGHEYKGEKFSQYLQLMTLCKHFIIPNSTFAWWAAWLSNNQDKIIIAPKIWYKDESYNTKDLLPDNWIKI